MKRREAPSCWANSCFMTLLGRPSSLDAYVFGHLAPILKCKLPNGKLQQHLKSLDNLTNFCTNILLLYFPRDGRGEFQRSWFVVRPSPPQQLGGVLLTRGRLHLLFNLAWHHVNCDSKQVTSFSKGVGFLFSQRMMSPKPPRRRKKTWKTFVSLFDKAFKETAQMIFLGI